MRQQNLTFRKGKIMKKLMLLKCSLQFINGFFLFGEIALR